MRQGKSDGRLERVRPREEKEGKTEHITGPLYNKISMSSTRARWPDHRTRTWCKVKYGTWSSGGGHHHGEGPSGLIMLSKWLEGMVFRVDVAFVKIGAGPCREAYDEPADSPLALLDVGPWLRS